MENLERIVYRKSRAFSKSPFYLLHDLLYRSLDDIMPHPDRKKINFLTISVAHSLYIHFGYDFKKFLDSSYEDLLKVKGVGIFSANGLYGLNHSSSIEEFESYVQELPYHQNSKPLIKQGEKSDIFKISNIFQNVFSYDNYDSIEPLIKEAIKSSKIENGVIDILRIGSHQDPFDDIKVFSPKEYLKKAITSSGLEIVFFNQEITLIIPITIFYKNTVRGRRYYNLTLNTPIPKNFLMDISNERQIWLNVHDFDFLEKANSEIQQLKDENKQIIQRYNKVLSATYIKFNKNTILNDLKCSTKVDLDDPKLETKVLHLFFDKIASSKIY